MPINFQVAAIDYVRFLPEIILTIFGIIIMVLEAAAPENAKRTPLGVVGVVGVVLAFAANIWANMNAGPAFSQMIIVDTYGTFFRGLVLIVGFLCMLSSFTYLEEENAQKGEYYALILFSLVGQCILAT